MRVFRKFCRRLRYGEPIIVVSGLPRSGTSMAMRMLEASGVPTLTDGIRPADESNPEGYYEFERIKELDKAGDTGWLADARGKAVKVISHLLTWLPESYQYRVILMDRNLDEVLASQNKMLHARGQVVDATNNDRVRRLYERHLEEVNRFLSTRPCFATLRLSYGDVIADPATHARRICEFLGGRLDADRMAAVVDPGLYRNRKSKRRTGA